MNEEKLSGDAVPGKFAEWLLSMGCPNEKVPPVEKIAEMCRGQYYMVWRGMIENVKPKDVIREQRLQVFADDIRQCQGNNAFNEKSSNKIVPPELETWRKQAELKQKVETTKSRVTLARQDLKQLMDKISNKIFQRNQSLQRAEDLQRRVIFLQQVCDELKNKKENLDETRSIADSLCSRDEDTDLQNKLDKCIASLKRQHSQPGLSNSMSNPVASSSMLSNGESEIEEQLLSSVVKSGGEALCSTVYTRRAALIRALAVLVTDNKQSSNVNQVTPQSVLTHTAAMHCRLALEATKNNIHVKKVRKQLVTAIDQLNNCLNGESCELLVTRCEKAHTTARVATLRGLYDELVSRSGVFQAEGGDHRSGGRSLIAIDKAIELKREETKRIIASISETENLIQASRDCLAAVFDQFAQPHTHNYNNYTMQLDPPSETITTLRQFYESRKDQPPRKANVSLDLDVSDVSYDATENCNPKLVDEFNIYLKKFNLEKNRKLVLESGEKIWIFETLQCSTQRLQNQWQCDDISCALLCPSESLTSNIMKLVGLVTLKEDLEDVIPVCGDDLQCIDITPQIEEDAKLNDVTKKRLHECLLDIQKTKKTLDGVTTNIEIWSDNKFRKYISTQRTVQGLTYKEYESYYLENCLQV
ncbi:uncharacterized protein LOC113230959 [Hyposmocoma kahamanoa]|uniref:uncharacterized protein LOC113230959 n=1 Tax=Hyposmocoma kahamanoa TaxID=1477025 RepID=UPI000E6D782C|nr:uncharacterized protein LOC113230959 [Hyposmocoma kahamanoa]